MRDEARSLQGFRGVVCSQLGNAVGCSRSPSQRSHAAGAQAAMLGASERKGVSEAGREKVLSRAGAGSSWCHPGRAASISVTTFSGNRPSGCKAPEAELLRLILLEKS